MASQSASANNVNVNDKVDQANDNNNKLKNDRKFGGFHERRPKFAHDFRTRVMHKKKNWRRKTTLSAQQIALTPSNTKTE